MTDNYVQNDRGEGIPPRNDKKTRNDRGEGIPPRNYEAGTLKREIASVVSLLCNDRFPSKDKKFHKDRIRTN